MSQDQTTKPIFPGQRDNEEIVMVIYKHWYIAVAPMLKALLIILLSFFLPVILGVAFFIFNYALSAAIYYLWILFWVGYIFYAYNNWLQDKFVVTDQRIVKIDQRGVFNRTVFETELNKIQNLTHSTKGMFATFFNFGTVIVQTTVGELTLDYVPNPVYIKEEIIQLTKEK
ncbi:MAG: PH domain-containing protein [Patescibacteria group bacterium]|nr:PH domain-containing protein [Patescibacteria group bacterium]